MASNVSEKPQAKRQTIEGVSVINIQIGGETILLVQQSNDSTLMAMKEVENKKLVEKKPSFQYERNLLTEQSPADQPTPAHSTCLVLQGFTDLSVCASENCVWDSTEIIYDGRKLECERTQIVTPPDERDTQRNYFVALALRQLQSLSAYRLLAELILGLIMTWFTAILFAQRFVCLYVTDNSRASTSNPYRFDRKLSSVLALCYCYLWLQCIDYFSLITVVLLSANWFMRRNHSTTSALFMVMDAIILPILIVQWINSTSTFEFFIHVVVMSVVSLVTFHCCIPKEEVFAKLLSYFQITTAAANDLISVSTIIQLGLTAAKLTLSLAISLLSYFHIDYVFGLYFTSLDVKIDIQPLVEFAIYWQFYILIQLACFIYVERKFLVANCRIPPSRSHALPSILRSLVVNDYRYSLEEFIFLCPFLCLCGVVQKVYECFNNAIEVLLEYLPTWTVPQPSLNLVYFVAVVALVVSVYDLWKTDRIYKTFTIVKNCSFRQVNVRCIIHVMAIIACILILRKVLLFLYDKIPSMSSIFETLLSLGICTLVNFLIALGCFAVVALTLCQAILGWPCLKIQITGTEELRRHNFFIPTHNSVEEVDERTEGEQGHVSLVCPNCLQRKPKFVVFPCCHLIAACQHAMQTLTLCPKCGNQLSPYFRVY